MLFGTYMKVKNEGGIWKPEGLFRRWVLALVLQWMLPSVWWKMDLCHEHPCLGKQGDVA